MGAPAGHEDDVPVGVEELHEGAIAAVVLVPGLRQHDRVGDALIAVDDAAIQDGGLERAGEFVLYWEAGQADALNVMLLPIADRRPRPWLRTRFDEWDAHASPDGRWVAYVSNESGRFEVYLRPFASLASVAAPPLALPLITGWNA